MGSSPTPGTFLIITKIFIMSNSQTKQITYFKTITGIMVFLCLILILIVFLQFVVLQKFKKKNSLIECVVPIISEEKKLYKIEDIIDVKKNFDSSISPNGLYHFLLLKNEGARWDEHNFRNGEGVMLLIREDLVFVNLETGEKKELSFEDLVSEEIYKTLESIPVQTQITFITNFLGWTNDGENLWFTAGLQPGGDPPVTSDLFLFKINVRDLSIDKHPKFPDMMVGLYPNLDKNLFLFDSVKYPELSLYLYDALNKEMSLIISYDNIDDKYSNGYAYIYPEFFGVERRNLRPEWLGENHFCYTDFTTGIEIIKKVE